jgi:hypothetical protein
MKYLAGIFALVFAVSITHGQYAASQNPMPAFNDHAPKKTDSVPPVLTQQQLAENGMTIAAQKEGYKAASKYGNVLYQLPCYCYCDRNHGHKSLHSCFEGTHGGNCGTCIAEALYAAKMTKKGWTVKQIREGIIRGDWKQIDLQNPEPVL